MKSLSYIKEKGKTHIKQKKFQKSLEVLSKRLTFATAIKQ